MHGIFLLAKWHSNDEMKRNDSIQVSIFQKQNLLLSAEYNNDIW